MELPDKEISGSIRVPIGGLKERQWWRRLIDGLEMAMIRSEGRRGLLRLGFGWENTTKGVGRVGDETVKLFRSSWKNLDGGGMSVITSSIFFFFFSFFSLLFPLIPFLLFPCRSVRRAETIQADRQDKSIGYMIELRRRNKDSSGKERESS